MDIFNLNLPEDDDYDGINDWFDFMNEQMRKIREATEKGKINQLLNDNDIDLIK